jgi:hypothetical protein
LGRAIRGPEGEVGALVRHLVEEGHGRELVSLPVVEDRLVGEVEDGLGTQVPDGGMKGRPRVFPGSHLDLGEDVQPLLGQLLAPPGENGADDLVAAGDRFFKRVLDDRRVVLSVYDCEKADRTVPRYSGNSGGRLVRERHLKGVPRSKRFEERIPKE